LCDGLEFDFGLRSLLLWYLVGMMLQGQLEGGLVVSKVKAGKGKGWVMC
jgi:hypothetical protein